MSEETRRHEKEKEVRENEGKTEGDSGETQPQGREEGWWGNAAPHKEKKAGMKKPE